MTPSPIAMGPINAINDHDGRNQHHHCEAPKCSQDERPSNATRRALVMSLGATRWPCQQMQQRSCEDVMSITTILIPRQQSLSTEHQLPQRKRDEHKQQSGGPLNRKPQADWEYSCLRSPATRTLRTTTKHEIKNLCKTIKKAATWQLRHVSRAQHLLDEQCTRLTYAVPSDNKASASCDDNNEDKNYHLHFDKKIEGRLCCCGSLCKTDHQWPSGVKRAKRKRRFLHFWTTISNFMDTVLMGLDSMDADLKVGLMTSWIRLILTNDSPPLLELVKVPRVQKNILKSYDTKQDYTRVNNCLIWKQQTFTVQCLW